MSFLLAEQYKCREFVSNKQNLTSNDTMIDVVITQKGLNKYANNNIDLATPYFDPVVLPDVVVDLDVMKLVIKDIHVANCIMPKVDLYYENNNIIASLKGWRFDYEQQFLMNQKVYPYIHDDGDSRLSIVMDAMFNLSAKMNENCKNRFEIVINGYSMNILDLRMSLFGKYEFLYDAVMKPLTKILKELFQGRLQPVINDILLRIAHKNINDMLLTSSIDKTSTYQMDQRWIDIKVDQQFLTATSPGQMTVTDDKMLKMNGWLDVQHIPHKKYVTNHDVQYYVQKDVFQTSINTYLAYEYKKHPYQNLSVDMKVIQVARTGLVVQASFNDSSAQFLMKSKCVVYKNSNVANVSVFTMQFEPQ